MYEFDPAALRRYRDRVWNCDEAATIKARASLPIDEKFRISRALWLGIRASRPEWPTEADRRADLHFHVELAQRFKRVTLG